MTTDLTYLALTALLTGSLWIPYVVAQVKSNGFLKAENYVDPTPRPVPLWGKRADRTYLNAVEALVGGHGHGGLPSQAVSANASISRRWRSRHRPPSSDRVAANRGPPPSGESR